jgi:hypothetical protein
MSRPDPEPVVVTVTKTKGYSLDDLDLPPEATEQQIKERAAGAFEFDIVPLDIALEESE